MNNHLLKVTIITGVILCIWIFYEAYSNKKVIETSENIQVIDATINVDVLGSLKNKHSF
jgi:hypothetical protein